MPKPTKMHQLSSDAKLLINEWPSLREILIEKVESVKSTHEHPPSSNPAILSDQQINNAFFGPWHPFFMQKLMAYARLGKARLQLSLAQDETFKEKLKNQPLAKDLEKLTLSDVDKTQSQLDDLMKKHSEEWETLLKEWNQQIVMALSANNILLSEIEINELKSPAPLSELFDRYTDLNLEVPTWEPTSFQRYCELKIYLVIHSCLSRNHQAHEPEEINKIVKKLKKELNTIGSQEKKCIDSQQKETLELIKAIPNIVDNMG